jgi:hypothetical protein
MVSKENPSNVQYHDRLEAEDTLVPMGISSVAVGGPLNIPGPPKIDNDLILKAGFTRPTRVITPKPQVAITDAELRVRLQWGHRTSSHFVVSYDRILFGEKEVEVLISDLESSYSSIFSLTHESFTDRFQIFAVDQRAVGLLGRVVHSHMNLEERSIYLVRTAKESLHSELIALLSHAMRLPRFIKHYGLTPGWAMLEDAFSVFLNSRLNPGAEVFPYYGVEPDLIAYHLYAHQLTRALADIWTGTAFGTASERYAAAGALFLYLGDTYSDDQVVTFSKCDEAITSDSFRNFFGRSLEAIEEQWVDHLPSALVQFTMQEQQAAIAQWERSFEGRK